MTRYNDWDTYKPGHFGITNMKQTFTMPDGEVINTDFPQWKTPYNHDREFESERTALFCKEPSLTKQEFKEETDINVILERFKKTQQVPDFALPEHFTDLTGRTNYFEMASQIAEANAIFYQLDAGKRAAFLNDPTRWADAVVQAVELNDRDGLKALGIAVPEPKPGAPAPASPPQGGTPAPAPAKAPQAPPASPGGAPNPAAGTPASG